MINPDILIPDPFADNRQYERFHCLDISSLEDDELKDEFYYLRARLWELPLVCWPRERVHLLKDEITHREHPRYAVREQQKPEISTGVKL